MPLAGFGTWCLLLRFHPQRRFVLLPAQGAAHHEGVGIPACTGEVDAVVGKILVVALACAVPVDDAHVVVLGGKVAEDLVIGVLQLKRAADGNKVERLSAHGVDERLHRGGVANQAVRS